MSTKNDLLTTEAVEAAMASSNPWVRVLAEEVLHLRDELLGAQYEALAQCEMREAAESVLPQEGQPGK